MAARAQVELACDSIRRQEPGVNTTLGKSEHKVIDMSEDDHRVAQSLAAQVEGQWSTFIMRTMPFSAELLSQVHPEHQVMMSMKPHKTGCHVWKPVSTSTNENYANFVHLLNSDNVVTVNEATVDNVNACRSIAHR